MAKIDDIKKEIEEYKELIADASVPQDEKDFAKGEIADLEKQLEALEKKTEKKAEPKTEKKEDKGEKKPEATAKKPKREEDEEEEADCDDLIEREQKASKLGYDIDELLTQAKQRKAKARERAQKMKGQPKKTPITKAKEKVEKTTKIIVKGLEKSAESGKLTVADLERLIAEYEEALKRFKKMLEKLRAEKMARGGNARKKPKMVRTIFEEEEFEYGNGGGIGEMIDTSGNSGWVYANSGRPFDNLEQAKKYADNFNPSGSRYKAGNIDVIVVENDNVGGYNVVYREKNYVQPERNLVKRVYSEGGGVPSGIRKRLEELRQEIRNESISYGEIAELQSLAKYIDEGDVELLEWAGVPEHGEEYRRGGRTTMVDEKRDKMFRAKPSGKRKSKKIAVVEMKSGGSYRRRNSNQYYNDDLGNRSQIGGRTYYEGANNRSDKNKWS